MIEWYIRLFGIVHKYLKTTLKCHMPVGIYRAAMNDKRVQQQKIIFEWEFKLLFAKFRYLFKKFLPFTYIWQLKCKLVSDYIGHSNFFLYCNIVWQNRYIFSITPLELKYEIIIIFGILYVSLPTMNWSYLRHEENESKIGQDSNYMQQADYQCHRTTPWMQ